MLKRLALLRKALPTTGKAWANSVPIHAFVVRKAFGKFLNFPIIFCFLIWY